ncbi:MAG: hypothetical protein ACE5GE_12310 [Phycisphaerae bacterium]
MKTFVVYYRYTRPGEKKPANVTHYRIQANDRREAERLMQDATAPGVQILGIKQV